MFSMDTQCRRRICLLERESRINKVRSSEPPAPIDHRAVLIYLEPHSPLLSLRISWKNKKKYLFACSDNLSLLQDAYIKDICGIWIVRSVTLNYEFFNIIYIVALTW